MTSATVFEHLTFDHITFDHLGTFGGPVLLGGQLYALTCHQVVFDGTIYSENRPVPEKDFEKNLYVPSQRKYDDYIRAREIFDRGDATKSCLAYVNITLVEDAPCPISAAPPLAPAPLELHGLTPLPIFGE
jgi:hypothetical protein